MPETVLQYILRIHSLCQFLSKDRPGTGKASNSEIRRWIEQGAVLLNTERCLPQEALDFPVFSVVFFPKSDKQRTTLL